MYKILFSLGIITFGLALGYAIQILTKSGRLHLEIDIDLLRKILQRMGVQGFMPIAFMGALWVAKLDDPSLGALPAIGAGVLLTGSVLGLLAAKLMRLERKKSGTMFICGFFSNLGAIGGLLCYLFLGEAGLVFLMLYRMFDVSLYFTIGFPVAKYYSGADMGKGFKEGLRRIATDSFVLVALSALAVGISLNLSGIPRPGFFRTVIEICVPMDALCLLVSVGLGIQFKKVGRYLKEGFSISAIKFIALPALAGAVAYLIGYGGINNGLPLKTVLIASSMPVAFNAPVTASIFDLDLDLANSCWFVSTIAMFVVIPWLYFVVNSL